MSTVKTNKVRLTNVVGDLICERETVSAPVQFVSYDGKIQSTVEQIDDLHGSDIYEPSVRIRATNQIFPSGFGKPHSADELYKRIFELVSEGLKHPDSEMIHLVSVYILATWNYDFYSSICYLAFVGSPGTGKSEALKIVGSLAYNSVRVSGGSSDAALFRAIDRNKGTLCIDEAQKSANNANSIYHQILAEGNQSHGVITRCRPVGKTGEYVEETFSVFGPKVFSGRSVSGDEAILSRTFKIQMPVPKVDETFKDTGTDTSWQTRAKELRNDLNLYRQRRAFGQLSAPNVATPILLAPLRLTPREKQVYDWLLKEAPNSATLTELLKAVQTNKTSIKQQRSHLTEAQVLRAAWVLLDGSEPTELGGEGFKKIKIRTAAGNRVLLNGVRELLRSWGSADIETKTVGNVLRNNGFETPHSTEGTYLRATAKAIADACERLGLDNPQSAKDGKKAGESWNR